jgi:hypothetical protein
MSDIFVQSTSHHLTQPPLIDELKKGTSSENAIDLDSIKQKEVVYWIKSLELMEEDKERLVGGHWLSDSHINAALQLLKKMYPQQNGLKSTQLLARKLQWKSSSVDFVQVVHISGNHWVCTSNIHSAPGVCDIYDSMAPSHSPTLTRQVAAIMQCPEPSFKMRHINVQMQTGGSDCGLFALAFATALCAGKDPHKCSFDQNRMRSHLELCLEKGEITEFPASIKPRRCSSSVKCVKSVQVYCTCRLPWVKAVDIYRDLAQCGHCKEWFHQKCMDIPIAAFVEQSYIWFCTSCS